ncbi:unnamed protein product [Vitrella brassicaformis CCMP3155]|uniref:Uncharacterized protein n=1 Tax=Vitrella brassicaformis (strain CCMP3155) TaxID=1169540 RepID=A0A0G4GGX9_VITBC|nr:unnamed protein product [Vitrella brassicaformis CCMP3155]|eukprot:CEM28872.1 unnamed protein product [Vitrella brassicaformis CCMP3155]
MRFRREADRPYGMKKQPQATMSSTGRKARCRSAAPSPSLRHPPPTPAKGRASTLTVASNSPNFATPTAYDEQWTQRVSDLEVAAGRGLLQH